jgi:enterobactin synthetase component D
MVRLRPSAFVPSVTASCGDRRINLLVAPHYLPVECASAAISIGDVRTVAARADLAFLPPGVARSVESRKLEHIGGRLCAERVLSMLGASGQGVGQRATGEPIWPPGFAGSISHTRRMAYAVVSSSDNGRRLGIDTEQILTGQSLDSVERLCCTRYETGLYLSSAKASLLATLIFSGKESLYKAIGAMVGRTVDFQEVEVENIDFVTQTMRFKALAGDLPSLSQCCTGYFRVHEGEVHTSVLWSTDPTPSSLSASMRNRVIGRSD